MPLAVTDRLHLLQRTRAFFDSQKRRARLAGKCLTYCLEDLHAYVERSLADPRCPYCQHPFAAPDLALCEKVPVNRGGRFAFKNVEVCCRNCQAARGCLDTHEFREVMLLIRTWPKPVQENFLAQLRAGADAGLAALPPVGSLEWFLGSELRHAGAIRSETSIPRQAQSAGSRAHGGKSCSA